MFTRIIRFSFSENYNVVHFGTLEFIWINSTLAAPTTFLFPNNQTNINFAKIYSNCGPIYNVISRHSHSFILTAKSLQHVWKLFTIHNKQHHPSSSRFPSKLLLFRGFKPQLTHIFSFHRNGNMRY